MRRVILFLRNKIELIVAIISVILAIYFYLDTKVTRELVIQSDKNPILIADSNLVSNTGIRVTRLDGSDLVGKVWIQPFVVWTPSKAAIKKEHLLTALNLYLENSKAEILDFGITLEIRPQVSDAKINKVNEDVYSLEFNVLESKDAIYGQVTYLSDEKTRLAFFGEIEGVDHILQSAPSDWSKLPWNILKVFSIFLMLFVFLYVLNKVDAIYKKSNHHIKYSALYNKITDVVFILMIVGIVVTVAYGLSTVEPPAPPSRFDASAEVTSAATGSLTD